MVLNGAQLIIAVIVLILTAAMTYVGKLDPQVFIAVLFAIVGYYFGEARGFIRSKQRRGD